MKKICWTNSYAVHIEVVLELVWNSFSCFCKIWWFESDGCFPTLDRPVSFDSITSKIFFIRPTFELTLERKTCLICQILWENKFSRREEMSPYLIIFSFNQITHIFHIFSSKWNLFVGSSSGLHHCRESIFKSTFSRKDSKLILFLWSDQFDADSIFYMTCIFHRQYILQMDKTTAKGQIFPFSSPRLSATTTRDKMGTRLLYFAARFNFVPFFWFLKFFFNNFWSQTFINLNAFSKA